MFPRSTIVTAVSALLVGSSLLAQQPAQHGGPPPGMSGMQACMEMMGGPSAAMILHHQQDLSLSPQQVQRLQAIQTSDSSSSMPHFREAMAAHREAAQLLRANHPDFSKYESTLRQAANHAILGHVAMARSAFDARNVLTSDQRTRLETMMKEMMDKNAMNGMRPMPGMKQSDSTAMKMMMMACPMMPM